MMITLKEISILSDNMKDCIALEILPEQWNYVALNVDSLAEAYDANQAYEKNGEGERAFPYAVYKGETMVGFVMFGYFPPEEGEDSFSTDEPIYYVWRLFVDKRYQRQGIGREILNQVMEIIKTKPCGEASFCYSSYVPENIGSKSTFAAYGYEEDGRVIDEETVCRYPI
jgi:diamine N-acetyltransferase